MQLFCEDGRRDRRKNVSHKHFTRTTHAAKNICDWWISALKLNPSALLENFHLFLSFELNEIIKKLLCLEVKTKTFTERETNISTIAK